MTQIADYLDAHSDVQYDAVHVLTHGNDSGVVLGSNFISDANDFSVFADHLTQDGDIMLYGCNMASSEAGQTFLQGIADAAGADVAASVDTTGSAEFNGNWNLEYSIGEISSQSISLDSSWNHRLFSYTIGDGGDYESLDAMLADSGLVWDTTNTITYLDGTHDTYHSGTIYADLEITVGGSDTSLTLGNDLTLNGISLTVNGMTITGNITVDNAGSLIANNSPQRYHGA